MPECPGFHTLRGPLLGICVKCDLQNDRARGLPAAYRDPDQHQWKCQTRPPEHAKAARAPLLEPTT